MRLTREEEIQLIREAPVRQKQRTRELMRSLREEPHKWERRVLRTSVVAKYATTQASEA